MLLMIDNYDSFTYNLVQYFQELGEQVQVVRNDEATVEELLKRKPDRVCISPVNWLKSTKKKQIAFHRDRVLRRRQASRRRPLCVFLSMYRFWACVLAIRP